MPVQPDCSVGAAMTRLLAILALMATPALAEPNDLIPDSGFIIGWTTHIGGTSETATGWDENGDLTYRPRWDEGLGIRGVGLTWETTYGDLSVSGYKNSLIDGGNGYSLTYSTPALLAAGGVSAHGVAQLNWYPDEPTEMLRETNGVFQSFGVSMRYEHASGVGIGATVYPSFGIEKSFDYLYVGIGFFNF